MNILVTGGLGFIGSNYINYIFHNDSKINRIINVDKFSYCSSKNYIDSEVANSNKYNFFKLNISNKQSVYKILDKYNINRVVNFAAYSHVDNSIKNPNKFIRSNISSFNDFIETCYRYWVKKRKNNFKFIHISTDEVFGSLSNSKNFFNEKSNYNPSSPYSSSKASTDFILNAYNHTFSFPSIITYSCNNFGPNQHKEKFIPTIINSCISKKNIPIYGNGKNIRQWIFVQDNVKYIHKLVLPNTNEYFKYCIGSKIELTNVDLVKMICDRFSNISPKKYNYRKLMKFVEDRKGHDIRYFMKSNHPLKNFKYQSFNESLSSTIEYYK